MPRQMPHQFLQRLEPHGAEAAIVPASALGCIYHIPMHRAQMLEQVSFLLEHGHTQPAREWLFARVHAQVSLEVPRHAELLPTVLASVFTHGRRQAARCSGPRAPRRPAGVHWATSIAVEGAGIGRGHRQTRCPR